MVFPIYNEQNTCFINVFLQLIISYEEFAEFLNNTFFDNNHLILLYLKKIYAVGISKEKNFEKELLDNVNKFSNLLLQRSVFPEEWCPGSRYDALSFIEAMYKILQAEIKGLQCITTNYSTFITKLFVIKSLLIYYLECGCKLVEDEEACFIKIYINQDSSVQKLIDNFLQEKINIANQKYSYFCHKCYKNCIINYIHCAHIKLPKYLLLEIEKGFIKHGKVCFVDKNIGFYKIVKVNNHVYNLVAAILFTNNHYSFIYVSNNDWIYINNENEIMLKDLDAYKLIEKWARCLKYKQKQV